MLYITTRGERDAFTAHRTLCTNVAPDGGLFLPMRFPKFSEEELRAIAELSFEGIIAHILNVFFSAGLSTWDVCLCGGRSTARITDLNAKTLMAELWHNSGDSFGHVCNGLYRRVFGGEPDMPPSEWFNIAVKIAVLFGIYGELYRQSFLPFGEQIDLSVPADDFSSPMAALYASKIGLPVGCVICNCIETQEVWNLLHRGSVSTLGLPKNLRAGLERLVLHRIGPDGIRRWENNRFFGTEPDELETLQNGLFCVVSGPDRIANALNSIYSTANRIVTPVSALCVVGLGDYRARTRGSSLTLILEEDSPVLFADQIEKATGISKKKLVSDIRE